MAPAPRRLAQFLRRNQSLVIGFVVFYVLLAVAISFDERNLPIVSQVTERPIRAAMAALFAFISIFTLYRFLRFYLSPDDDEDDRFLSSISGTGSQIELISKAAAEANRQTNDVLASLGQHLGLLPALRQREDFLLPQQQPAR
jgi:hypothetical protein